jgi:iron complex outermembrane receptor protein
MDITMATNRSFRFSRSPIAAAALLLATAAHAQTTTLAPVTVTGRADPAAGVSGWGNVPLSQTPLQATILSAEQLSDRGALRLADIVKIDPSVSDAYNSEGYWDFLAVRGFVLDNRFNYRRDGLPINAETSIPLENKDRIEILKGTSGIQAGTSSPGGLVNLVVKRPTEAPLRNVQLGWRERGSVLGAVSLVVARPRPVTIKAVDQVETLFVPRAAFMKLANQTPELAARAAERIRRELTGYLTAVEQVRGKIGTK